MDTNARPLLVKFSRPEELPGVEDFNPRWIDDAVMVPAFTLGTVLDWIARNRWRLVEIAP